MVPPGVSVVGTYERILDAEVVRGRLEAEGIRAVVDSEAFPASLGPDAPYGGLARIRLLVRSEDLERARAILATKFA